MGYEQGDGSFKRRVGAPRRVGRPEAVGAPRRWAPRGGGRPEAVGAPRGVGAPRLHQTRPPPCGRPVRLHGGEPQNPLAARCLQDVEINDGQRCATRNRGRNRGRNRNPRPAKTLHPPHRAPAYAVLTHPAGGWPRTRSGAIECRPIYVLRFTIYDLPHSLALCPCHAPPPHTLQRRRHRVHRLAWRWPTCQHTWRSPDAHRPATQHSHTRTPAEAHSSQLGQSAYRRLAFLPLPLCPPSPPLAPPAVPAPARPPSFLAWPGPGPAWPAGPASAGGSTRASRSCAAATAPLSGASTPLASQPRSQRTWPAFLQTDGECDGGLGNEDWGTSPPFPYPSSPSTSPTSALYLCQISQSFLPE
jgi:hypothetical protein